MNGRIGSVSVDTRVYTSPDDIHKLCMPCSCLTVVVTEQRAVAVPVVIVISVSVVIKVMWTTRRAIRSVRSCTFCCCACRASSRAYRISLRMTWRFGFIMVKVLV
jgi:hypothetical protein